MDSTAPYAVAKPQAAPAATPEASPRPGGALADTLTILQAFKPLCKTHRPGGSEPYSRAARFRLREERVWDIDSLSAALRRLETQRHDAVVRASPRPEVDWKEPQRRLIYPDQDKASGKVYAPTLAPASRRWMCLDLDQVEPPPYLTFNDDVDVALAEGLEWVLELLPPWLREVSCHWQWSASMGVGEAGWSKLKLHLWFWLDTPVEDLALRAWARGLKGLKVDEALYSAAQLHYTAAPIFEGLPDPLAGRRSGLWRGMSDVATPPPEITRWRELEEARREEARRLLVPEARRKLLRGASYEARLRAWAQVGCEEIRTRLVSSGEGSRHAEVMRAAGSLANSITWGALSWDEALSVLDYSPVAQMPGRGENELREALKWALERAKASPKPPPDLERGGWGEARRGEARTPTPTPGKEPSDAAAFRDAGAREAAALLGPPPVWEEEEDEEAWEDAGGDDGGGGGDDEGGDGGGWGEDERPEVFLKGDLHLKSRQLFDAIERVQAGAPSLFVRGREVVRLVRDEGRGAVLEPVRHEALRAWLLERATFLEIRATKEGGKWVPSDLKDQLLKNVLAQGSLPLPPCERVLHAPVFGEGGAFISSEGYHPELRAVLDLGGFQPRPPRPGVSMEETAEALDLLRSEWLVDFPFDDEASFLHALALALTPLVRPLIQGPVPLFLVSATAPGTGKTKLVDALAYVTTGEETLLIPEAKDDDEWRKKITTALLSQPAYALLDNVNHALDSGSLASVLTRSRWDDRRLGGNETISTPNETTWIVTANHPKLSSELVRRVVWIGLDAKTDSPDERSGFRHPHLERWTRQERTALLHALCTLVQYWVDQGMPRGEGYVLGSFDAWAEVLGGIMMALGAGEHFLANRQLLKERANPENAEWRAFFEVWWGDLGKQPSRAGDLAELADAHGLLEMRRTGRNDALKSQKFGYALRELRDAGRVIGRWRIAPGGTARGNNLYRLEEVEP